MSDNSLYRQRRGASWVFPAKCFQVAYYCWHHQSSRSIGLGFRLIEEIEDDETFCQVPSVEVERLRGGK